MEKSERKKLKKGRTSGQKKAIDYFYKPRGCIFGKVYDSTYDYLVLKKLNALGAKNKARERLGLDAEQIGEISPIALHGYTFKDAGFRRQVKRIGDDGMTRSSAYNITWLFFSDEQLFTWSLTFDMLSRAKREITREFFYKDITSVSILTDTFEGGDRYHVFQITVSGDKFTCPINATSKAEQAIQGMKQKIREKKSAK